MTRAVAPGVAHGLEIGCAAGAFTERMARHCTSLHVVDLLQEALDRCRARLGAQPHVRYSVLDLSAPPADSDTYDLVVLSEVTYYLGSRDAVEQAMRYVARLVAPGGFLVFGSATDETVRRWKYQCGAETALAAITDTLTIVDQVPCTGQTADECALITRLVKPVAGAAANRP